MYIKRKLEDTILKHISDPEIIAIVGARQSGKTTILKKVYDSLKSEAVFLSFEDKKILNLFEKNIEDFVKLYIAGKKYLFIDEFQYAKHGGKQLKYIYDLHPIKIFISGSSAVDLTVNALKFLVGRIFVFTLYPFDFEEFLNYKNKNLYNIYKKEKINLRGDFKKKNNISENLLDEINRFYDEYAVFGGYPRVVLANSEEDKKNILANIYNTYFLREVKDILGLIDDFKLSNLIKALALQSGNLIEYNDLCDISELTYLTLKKYINFLEKTYVCVFLRPFYKNRRTEIVKNPKVYFLDTGLLNYIVDDFRKINDRPNPGQIIENVVFQQLIKQDYKINFWRTKAKDEVDFVLQLGDGKIFGLEIKNNSKKIKFSKSMKMFEGKYGAETGFAYYTGYYKKDPKELFNVFSISLF